MKTDKKLDELYTKLIQFRLHLKNADISLGGTVVICKNGDDGCTDIIDFFDKHFNIKEYKAKL